MTETLFVLGALSGLFALASILLGANLTRSVMAAYACVGCLCLALLVAGTGFLALVVSILALGGLASIQVLGWMLVDIDRDRIASTDAPTWIARILAFALLGGGIVLLGLALAPELSPSPPSTPPVAPPLPASGASLVELGHVLFGPFGGAALLLGLTIAAGLLATMLLLRSDEEGG